MSQHSLSECRLLLSGCLDAGSRGEGAETFIPSPDGIAVISWRSGGVFRSVHPDGGIISSMWQSNESSKKQKQSCFSDTLLLNAMVLDRLRAGRNEMPDHPLPALGPHCTCKPPGAGHTHRACACWALSASPGHQPSALPRPLTPIGHNALYWLIL